jgi:peroxiredoxin
VLALAITLASAGTIQGRPAAHRGVKVDGARHDEGMSTGAGDWPALPAELPRPIDDGAAAHLPGARMPSIALPATDGTVVALDRLPRRTVIYTYPRTGRPGVAPLVADWDLIPGARGCTPEACGFRDHHRELAELEVDVYGLSTQDTEYQREAVERLQLPFSMLSDSELRLTHGLHLPTLAVAGHVLLQRLTLLIFGGVVERVWYPVFPPDAHADEVLAWLRGRVAA